jgi:hypothetical protein
MEDVSMIHSTLRSPFIALALSFVYAAVAFGQSPTSTWEGTRMALVNSKQSLYVVTMAHPKRRHACLIQSINASEIVCTHHGRTTAYRAGNVAALIFPGTHTRWYLYAAGFLAGSGAATWGTVVLAPICIPCAAVTGIAAFFLFWMAPASAMMTDGDSSDTLLYLAPGQTLKVKLS